MLWIVFVLRENVLDYNYNLEFRLCRNSTLDRLLFVFSICFIKTSNLADNSRVGQFFVMKGGSLYKAFTGNRVSQGAI